MKKNQVKLGHVYKVKVSGTIAPVQIIKENPHGGWDGANLATGKRVRIKSAQRLRAELPKPDAKRPPAGKAGAAPSPTGAKKAAKAAKDATTPKKADTGERRGKGAKRPSALDAAAKVLALGDRLPMRCKDIVKIMLDRGLWKTNGKTPAATIYAAILREIQKKGDAARFRKVERGKFTLATGKGK